jgi:hypothetical protein
MCGALWLGAACLPRCDATAHAHTHIPVCTQHHTRAAQPDRQRNQPRQTHTHNHTHTQRHTTTHSAKPKASAGSADAVQPGADIRVGAKVRPNLGAIGSVTLLWRTNYGPEQELAMDAAQDRAPGVCMGGGPPLARVLARGPGGGGRCSGCGASLARMAVLA